MNLQKTLKFIVHGGIMLIPFTGLIISSSFFFPYITPKNLFFRLVVLIVFAAYIYLAHIDHEYRPRLGKIGYAITTFITVLFVADLSGIAPHKSFFSNFERMEGFFTLLLLAILFVVMSSSLKTTKIWAYLFKVSLATSVFMGFYALAESAKGVDRLAAQLGNSTYLGAFMLFNIFIGLLALVRLIENKERDIEMKWFGAIGYAAIIIFDFYIFYRTGTRGALLGLMAGSIFAAILFAFFQKKSKNLKVFGLVILTLVIVGAGSLFILRNSAVVKNNNLLNRFATVISAPTDIQNFVEVQGKGRLGIWALAIEGVKERPILGWGQDNFNYIFNKYYQAKLYDQESWFDRAHNVFLDWLTAGGILGLLSYLLIFAAAFYSLWRSKDRFSFEDKAILTALLIAYFIHNLFVFDSITSYILFFSILAYIASQGEEHKKILPVGLGVATSGIVLSAAGLYFLVALPFASSTNLIQALMYQSKSDFAKSLTYYQKSLEGGVVGSPEVREQLLQNTPSILGSTANEEIKKAFVKLTDEELLKQISQTPQDARYQLFTASYLARTNRLNEAEPYFKKAEELSPQKQSMYFEHGIAYVNTQNYKEAVAILKHAYEIYPQNPQSVLYYAVALIYSGDNKTADALIAPFKNTDTGTDMSLIKAYYDTKQNAKILDVLQQKLFIAGTYAKAGDRQNAIREIQEVIDINPAFKEQGEAYIKQI